MVKIVSIGSEKNVGTFAGMTVEQALSAAQVEYTGFTVKRNSQPTGLNDKVYDGDILALTPKVSGGVR